LLLDGRFIATGTNRTYDVASDGQRFLISVAPGDRQREAAQIVVVQNWLSEARALLSAPHK